MDGWSAPVLVGEVLAAYQQGGSAASLPKVTPYRDYLRFIAGQDQAAALAAWRDTLDGLEEGTHLAPRPMQGQAAVVPEQVVLSLDTQLSQALTLFSREHALTLNTVLQAAYGLLLGRQLNRDDVVFGVTVAGRPAELAWRRADGGAVHQHAAAADEPAAAAAADRAAEADPGPAVGAVGAPACGACGDPAGRGSG